MCIYFVRGPIYDRLRFVQVGAITVTLLQSFRQYPASSSQRKLQEMYIIYYYNKYKKKTAIVSLVIIMTNKRVSEMSTSHMLIYII